MIFGLFGPPGAGKGTQSTLLVKRRSFFQLSTGEILRSQIREGTLLGQKAQVYVNQGLLVPDELMVAMVGAVLSSEQLKEASCILDGFPRNLFQAQALDQMLRDLGKAFDMAIFLEVPSSELLTRLSGRRLCQKCGKVLHVKDLGGSIESGVSSCDNCGGGLIQRSDDRPEVISRRLQVYDEAVSPLRDYYRALGIYFEVSGVGTTDEIYGRIEGILDNAQKKVQRNGL